MLRRVPTKLYLVPGSHPSEAVAKALELKGIPYERVYLVPPLHKALQKARFGASTVPGVAFEDGEKVTGSRAIITAIEKRRPDPPLRPAQEPERRAVHDAEEWGEQVLQPLARRLSWWALTNRPEAQISYLGDAKLFPPTPRFAAKLAGRPVAWAARRINDVSEANVKADLAHLPTHLDRVDSWIADGVIGGETPNAADLQIASSLRLLQSFEDLRGQIDARPAGELARRLFPQYPGSTPAGALPVVREAQP
jgi:glutathione S-transferase